MINHEVDFLIIGNNNSITYKNVFPFVKDNVVKIGYTANKTLEYVVPFDYSGKTYIKDGVNYCKMGSTTWFTTLGVKDKPFLKLDKIYDSKKYPKYDNYDAIEVSRVKDIPFDYDGVMGVPITFLDKYDGNQFKIVGLGTSRIHYTPNKRYKGLKTINKNGAISSGAPINSTLAIKIDHPPKNKKYYTDSSGNYYLQPYARILIKHKKPLT